MTSPAIAVPTLYYPQTAKLCSIECTGILTSAVAMDDSLMVGNALWAFSIVDTQISFHVICHRKPQYP